MSKLEMLRNGECALVNTGTADELKRVLKHCFPKDSSPVPTQVKYFMKDFQAFGNWLPTYGTGLEKFPTSDFIAELDEIEKPIQTRPFTGEVMLDEEMCIKYLKERNYKILKPITKHEEI
jgi:hypothetical protein